MDCIVHGVGKNRTWMSIFHFHTWRILWCVPFNLKGICFAVVQSLSHVWLFVTPWTAARQAPLSFTISWSSLELMFIESAMPSNHLILCHPLLLLPLVFPRIKVFSVSQFFPSGGQRIGASVSVLPMNIQGWFPLGLTGLISLLSKGLSGVFPSTTV